MAIEVGTKEAATALGVSEVSCHKLRQCDDGPPFEKYGGRYKYPLGKLLRWLLDRERRQIDAKLDRVYERMALIEAQFQKEHDSAEALYRRKLVNILSAAHDVTLPQFYEFLADHGYRRVKDIPPAKYDEVMLALTDHVAFIARQTGRLSDG